MRESPRQGSPCSGKKVLGKMAKIARRRMGGFEVFVLMCPLFRHAKNAPFQAIWKALGKRHISAAHAPDSINLVRIANG